MLFRSEAAPRARVPGGGAWRPRRRLRARVIFLRRIKRDLEGISKNPKGIAKHLQIILEHDLDLVSAEIKSIAKLIQTLQ